MDNRQTPVEGEPPPSERAVEAVGRGRRGLGVVLGVVFLDLLGFGIILPSLPYYADFLGASGFGLGVLTASYSVAQLVGAALLGRLSDRFGRRPVLLASLAGSSFAMVLTGLAGSLVGLCAARALAGLFGGSIGTAQAFVADVTDVEERPRYMGLLGAAIGCGFVAGPALGAGLIAAGFGFREAAFVAAALAAGNLLLGMIRLQESRTSGTPERAAPGGWLAALRRPDLRRVLFATFAAMFGFVAMETTFAYLGRDLFGMRELRFGLVLVYVGGVMIVVRGASIGPLAGRLGVRTVAVSGAVLVSISLVALPWMPSLLWAMVAMGGLAVGQGLASPTLSTLNSYLSAADGQGAALGLGQSFAATARAVGPLVAGALYDLHLAAPYLAGGGLALLGAVLVAGVSREEPHDRGVEVVAGVSAPEAGDPLLDPRAADGAR